MNPRRVLGLKEGVNKKTYFYASNLTIFQDEQNPIIYNINCIVFIYDPTNKELPKDF